MNYNHLAVHKQKDGIEWSRYSSREILQYALGGLLYAPANHTSIGNSICNKRFPEMKNIVLCLEDTIMDDHVKEAEIALIHTIRQIYTAVQETKLKIDEIPLIFIRVRSAEQMADMFIRFAETVSVIAGFVLPKFDSSNAAAYCDMIRTINTGSESVTYIMPIIESLAVIRKKTRMDELMTIKQAVDSVRDYVLNVRVGGNDFCHAYGLRRSRRHTIYDVSLVRDVLTDILNFFSEEYVVSAPVWEYFGSEKDTAWQDDMRRELELDLLNGFIGKTAIHPSQLNVIQESLVIPKDEYEDALALLQWDGGASAVAKSTTNRMNEFKVHERWARKILALANIYGVK